jgi:hypothetical protein
VESFTRHGMRRDDDDQSRVRRQSMDFVSPTPRAESIGDR